MLLHWQKLQRFSLTLRNGVFQEGRTAILLSWCKQKLCFCAAYKHLRSSRVFRQKLLPKLQSSVALGLLSLTVTGCMMGPDFHTPQKPQVSSFTASPLPAKTASIKAAGKGGKAQYFVSNDDIKAEWWTLFHSQELNDLIAAGLANSPNLTSAQAALRQAQENVNVQVGNSLYPAFNAQLAGERQRFSLATIGGSGGSKSPVFNLFNTNVNVSYTLDVFGSARRQIESLVAQVDYQQFQLVGAYLTLTSNIVTTAVNIASLEKQIESTKKIIKVEEAQLEILKKQFRLGGISAITVFTQQTLVDQTRATLPPLENSLSQSRHALAVLIGEFPNKPIKAIDLDKLTLPSKIPVSLPSNLVRQRPDVRAQEALLHAASAQIGVATANLLPQFNITGNYGWESVTPAGLLNSKNEVWAMMSQITQPIFHGGALRAQRRAAIAAYDQTAAQYRETVLQAFQNVADSLRAIETDARTLRAQKQAEIAAYNNLRLSQDQYRLGGASYLTLLTAEQQYHQTVIARIRAQAARYSDTTALFQSLGGGWWNRQTEKCGDPINPMHASLTCP